MSVAAKARKPTKYPSRVDIEFSDAQYDFIFCDAPTVVFQGGAGSGKTWAGAAWVLCQMLYQPESRGLVAAATYPMLTQSFFPHLAKVAELFGIAPVLEHLKGEKQFKLSNGASFWYRSAENPESLLGTDAAWIYGDEVALWREEAFMYSAGRLRQTGMDAQAAFTFTPKGRNWAWNELSESSEGTEVIQVTTMDNPYLKDSYIDRLRRTYGEGTRYWRQEVLGEYVAYEGLVYPDFEPRTHITRAPGEGYVRTVAGVDWGWTNPGSIIVVSMHANGDLWVRAEAYESNRPVEWWAAQAKTFKDRYQIDTFYCDPEDPGSIDVFCRAGLRAVKAANALEPGVAAVGSRLTNRTLFVDPACANLIREFSLYSYKRMRDGTSTDQIERKDDHAQSGLRYAVMGMIAPQPARKVRFV